MDADLTTAELSTEMLNDRELLIGGAADAVEENPANARRRTRMIAFSRRRGAATRDQDPDDHFSLTAREQGALEVSCLWPLTPSSRQQHSCSLQPTVVLTSDPGRHAVSGRHPSHDRRSDPYPWAALSSRAMSISWSSWPPISLR